jgi:predicted lipid-binding transport protein (Tim44 family)
MATTDRGIAVAAFTDFTHAEQAIEELRRSGFASELIGFIAADPPKIEVPLTESGTQATKGAAVGAGVGGILGAALGLVVAEMMLPLAGPVIVGGLLTGVLGGALTGGAGGGILGGLLGLSVPEQDARHFAQQFHSGRSLVTVQAGDRYEEAAAILRRAAEQPEHHHSRQPAYDLSADNHPGDGDGSVFVPRP